MEHVLGLDGRVEEVAVGDRRSVTDLGTQVPAEERAGLLFEEHVRLPVVGHVGCGHLEHPALQRRAAEVEHLAVIERTRWPVAVVVQREHAAEGAMDHLRAQGFERAIREAERRLAALEF
jgi:hypothetical protein